MCPSHAFTIHLPLRGFYETDLSWNDHIISEAKASSCKLGFLFQPFRTSSKLLTLNKAQIRPCLEYGSHLWRRALKHSLAT